MELLRRWFRTGDNREALRRLDKYKLPRTTMIPFASWMLQGPDCELFLVNPAFVLEKFGLSEQDGLQLILAVVAENLFKLGWHIDCPACKMHGGALSNISQLPAKQICPACATHYNVHLDQEVTVTLTIHHKFRKLDAELYDHPEFRAGVDQRLGAFSAMRLVNSTGFRRLIADQQFEEGQWIGVQETTIFFSDLKQSTAFYHKLGDGDAYHWVAEHFKIMFAAVEMFGGTAVKTMGDGVMGVFTDPVCALRSLIEASTQIKRMNEASELKVDDQLILKIGLHKGTCILVTLNGRLDYFGETVNIAARLGGISSGNDIVFSSEVLEDPQFAKAIESFGPLHELNVPLRGLPGVRHLYRVELDL